MSASTIRTSRARVATLSRHRAKDDPDLIEARRDLAEANIAEHIARVIAKAPPLTSGQRARLAQLLKNTGGAA